MYTRYSLHWEIVSLPQATKIPCHFVRGCIHDGTSSGCAAAQADKADGKKRSGRAVVMDVGKTFPGVQSVRAPGVRMRGEEWWSCGVGRGSLLNSRHPSPTSCLNSRYPSPTSCLKALSVRSLCSVGYLGTPGALAAQAAGFARASIKTPKT